MYMSLTAKYIFASYPVYTGVRLIYPPLFLTYIYNARDCKSIAAPFALPEIHLLPLAEFAFRGDTPFTPVKALAPRSDTIFMPLEALSPRGDTIFLPVEVLSPRGDTPFKPLKHLSPHGDTPKIPIFLPFKQKMLWKRTCTLKRYSEATCKMRSTFKSTPSLKTW
jgi:hypothetical protein